MGNSAKRDARAIAVAERRRKALELRESGKSYEAIAEELGYGDRSNCHKAVQKAIRAITEEPAEEVRKLELRRLDAMLAGLWKKASEGDLLAIDRALRIQDRRAAYLGLDAPKLLKVELERELSTHVARLRASLPDDVFEQVIRVLAGEPGAAGAGGDPDGAPEGDDDRGD